MQKKILTWTDLDSLDRIGIAYTLHIIWRCYLIASHFLTSKLFFLQKLVYYFNIAMFILIIRYTFHYIS